MKHGTRNIPGQGEITDRTSLQAYRDMLPTARFVRGACVNVAGS